VNHLIKCAAATTVLAILSGHAVAGGIDVDIRIGNPPPPPPPVIVVREEVVVREPVVYESYVVGYRRDLYDADLRLRIARADEWQAHEELDAARRHEGEVAVQLDETEARIEGLRHRAGGSAEGLTELHAKVAGTAEVAADLHKKLAALEHRISAAREDFDAAKTLHDDDGMDDAAGRIKSNERRAASTAQELHETEERLAHLRGEETAVASIAADREHLHDAEARARDLHHQLEIAHEAVYSCQHRLTASQDAVFVAVHDRDEALWLLHRDEIFAGRYEPERCGFHIDLSLWGGRLPRDPEVLHAHCVHEVGYWRSNPVYVEQRVVEVDRVTEVTHIREIQRVREVEKIQRVERVETVVKVEDRRRFAEVSVVERKRFEAETVERKTAVVEHRAPRPVYIERPTTVTNVSTVNNVNTNVTNNTTVNRNVTVNNNVTNVTKVVGNPREEARLREEVRVADAKADAARKGQAEEAARLKRDEAKLAEQSKQIAAERRDERHTDQEIARLKADQEKIEKKVDRTAERPAEKPVERRAERPVDQQPIDSRPTVDSRRVPAPADDSAPRNRRRGDAPDPRDSRDARDTRDSRDSRNSKDPRAPRDGQTSVNQ
jgi:hypothetical protein